ncbi:unnamed protein product [Rhizoctonia solani]|uniref:Uncharacterized protein n=1 Tax=Rhizoctonia solani TaxID=456999 RepID=A0A8H3HHC4_9AGAM|nr:unnamed protein product [Rhizoctonia solani]
MPEASKLQDAFPAALLKWETAGVNLATALSAYLESCVSLNTSGSLGQCARTIASRVDIFLDVFHSKFFQELSRSRVLLVQMRNNILAPSFSLPAEILAEIFEDAVYIPVSNRCNIHLAAFLLDRPHGKIAPFIDKKIPQFTSINIEARFQSPASDISNFLTRMFTSQSPSVLSKLSIHHYEDLMVLYKRPPRLPKSDEYIKIYSIKFLQSLSVFRFRNINNDWDTLKFSKKLVEIHLQSVVLGDQSKLIQFFHTLESAPALRELKFISVGAFADGHEYLNFDITPVQIALSQLQSLLLDDLPFNILETVLISMPPGSHKIKLRFTSKTNYTQGADDDSSWGDDQRLESLLKRSHIDTLFLSPYDEESEDRQSPWVDPEELLKKLRLFPDLKTSITDSWKWDEGALLALDGNNGGHPGAY